MRSEEEIRADILKLQQELQHSLNNKNKENYSKYVGKFFSEWIDNSKSYHIYIYVKDIDENGDLWGWYFKTFDGISGYNKFEMDVSTHRLNKQDIDSSDEVSREYFKEIWESVIRDIRLRAY